MQPFSSVAFRKGIQAVAIMWSYDSLLKYALSVIYMTGDNFCLIKKTTTFNVVFYWVFFFLPIYLDAKGCPLLDCLAFLFEDSKPDVLQLPVLVSVPWYSSVVRCTTTFGTTKSSIQTYKRYATRDSTLELALFVGDQFSWISWVIYPYPRIYVFTKEQQSSKLWNITMHQSSYQQICVFTNQKINYENPQTLTSHE